MSLGKRDSKILKKAFPSDMSLGNLWGLKHFSLPKDSPATCRWGKVCHRGTNCLTEKRVGPTSSLGIIAGDCIPDEDSPATIPQRHFDGDRFPQRHFDGDRFPQRHVAGESPEMLLGKTPIVVVTLKCVDLYGGNVVQLIIELLPHARGLRFESLREGFLSRWESGGFCPIDASIRGWQGLPSGKCRPDADELMIEPLQQTPTPRVE
ncbi:hypothetical protein Tco_1139262 [Tanacetum coccineum]